MEYFVYKILAVRTQLGGGLKFKPPSKVLR